MRYYFMVIPVSSNLHNNHFLYGDMTLIQNVLINPRLINDNYSHVYANHYWKFKLIFSLHALSSWRICIVRNICWLKNNSYRKKDVAYFVLLNSLQYFRRSFRYPSSLILFSCQNSDLSSVCFSWFSKFFRFKRFLKLYCDVFRRFLKLYCHYIYNITLWCCIIQGSNIKFKMIV